ncbi:stage II sporulation protein R [Clostridium carnis]
MKKIIIVLLNIMLVLSFLSGCTSSGGIQGLGEKELVYEDIVDKIIRFHVIANSDSEEDQSLKLKVRDKVIDFISGKLSNCTSLDEAREVVLSNKNEINRISSEVIKENGYTYKVTSMLSRENFPDKVYGEMVFPQGEYEAFRILIGEASGQNWWCVMFPPLCFVDGTKDAVNSKKNEESLGKLLSKEYKNKKDINIKEEKNKKVQFKSKILEKIFGENK